MNVVLDLGTQRHNHILVPASVLEPHLQPDLFKFNHEKKIFVYANFGLVNKYRKSIYKQLKNSKSEKTIVTMEIVNHRSFKAKPQDVWLNMTKSLFCLIIAGDLPFQKRFFDAALSGCLPVVLLSGKSWWSFDPKGDYRK